MSTKGAKVRCVTKALEGTTAEWMVILHNDASELRNFDCFMATLQKSFEDTLADCKARDHIKTISQGCREEAEYTQEFCDLAC